MLVARRHSCSITQAAKRLNSAHQNMAYRVTEIEEPAKAQPAAMATANTSVPTRTIMLRMVTKLRVFTECRPVANFTLRQTRR